MIKLVKEELEKKIKEGVIVYIEGSNVTEKRLYRFNNKLNSLEYSDDNKIWKESNMNIDELKNNEWIIYEG